MSLFDKIKNTLKHYCSICDKILDRHEKRRYVLLHDECLEEYISNYSMLSTKKPYIDKK